MARKMKVKIEQEKLDPKSKRKPQWKVKIQALNGNHLVIGRGYNHPNSGRKMIKALIKGLPTAEIIVVPAKKKK